MSNLIWSGLHGESTHGIHQFLCEHEVRPYEPLGLVRIGKVTIRGYQVVGVSPSHVLDDGLILILND